MTALGVVTTAVLIFTLWTCARIHKHNRRRREIENVLRLNDYLRQTTRGIAVSRPGNRRRAQ